MSDITKYIVFLLFVFVYVWVIYYIYIKYEYKYDLKNDNKNIEDEKKTEKCEGCLSSILEHYYSKWKHLDTQLWAIIVQSVVVSWAIIKMDEIKINKVIYYIVLVFLVASFIMTKDIIRRQELYKDIIDKIFKELNCSEYVEGTIKSSAPFASIKLTTIVILGMYLGILYFMILKIRNDGEAEMNYNDMLLHFFIFGSGRIYYLYVYQLHNKSWIATNLYINNALKKLNK